MAVNDCSDRIHASKLEGAVRRIDIEEVQYANESNENWVKT